MIIGELRTLIEDADDDQQVLALVDDESHREVSAEIDSDGDLIIKLLSWSLS
jgi:hypothetical protein